MPETATLSENPRKRAAKKDLRGASIVGDNGPTRDDILFFAGLFAKDQAAIKAAQKARKATRQRAQLFGIKVEILDEVMREAEKEDDTTHERLSTFKQYAEFMGLPIGSQLTLFDAGGSTASSARETLLDKAEREGRELGVMGKNTDEQKYPPMTDEGQAHLRGWHEGQKVQVEKFLKHNEEVAAAAAAEEAKKNKRKAKSAEPEADDEAGEEEAAGDPEPTKH